MSSYPRVLPQEQQRERFRSKDRASSDSYEDSYDNQSESAGAFSTNTALPAPRFIGRSPAIKQLFSIIDKIGPTDSSVLISGQTGTGKELVARAVHERSSRRDRPFIDINCSAIPETLIEAEFFGHQRGTFTGAHETRRGLFEEASGGTLFLDEIDSLDLAAQSKLLRVLQERRLRRVGGRGSIEVDVRIVAATNRDLHTAILQGEFRADLFFRLCVIPLHVPELSQRGNDIPLLIEHFLARHDRKVFKQTRYFSQAAMSALLFYSWPGNVRELENAVEYALAVSDNQEIVINDLPLHVLRNCTGKADAVEECLSGVITLAELERRHIISMFERFGRHHINTADALGIDRRTLYRKLRQYHMVTQQDKKFGEML